MQKFSGVGVSPGRVLGTVRQMPAPVTEPQAGDQRPADSTAEQEADRLRSASKSVQAQLKARSDAAAKAGNDEAKAVLEATALMAADPMLIKSAVKLIEKGISAERAVWEAGGTVAETLKGLGGYMAERSQDVLDVRSRIVAELRGMPAPGIPASETPFILAGIDLAPADTATLDPALVIGLATSEGGPQSHTAILARALGLPAVVAAPGVEHLQDGVEVFLDGAAGVVVTEPGDEERRLAQTWKEKAGALPAFDGHGQLGDGHRIPLLANIGGASDAVVAAEAGAEGVGLMRTEFCFLDRDTEPTVEEQVAKYQPAFEAFAGKKMVVRTLDAGADKPLPFLTDASEPNPALGVRGYRTRRTDPSVIDRQIQAIGVAAAAAEKNGKGADVWVMAPMIATAEETKEFVGLCREAGIKSAGVMIEVPSAALTAKSILSIADFASLGTNDLTQYAMAADRQLGSLAALNDPWQPAVLQLVAATVLGARAASDDVAKPVGVCGESAADPALAVVLAGIGVSTLSMTSRALPAVSAVLRSVTLAQAQELAQLALGALSAGEARAAVRAKLPVLEELGL
ncbi:phosphoenolpyruvate--protein phosphotransferase [Paenarthrobacter sp. DKR-5]|uniref:phosphoenolpyruvate--protein phosphotransferase n=1 Tax=Paenarthrobacter sp. DKR-5 TaxID=2835535 RepID=UPI001BDD7F87|nr:phosphoenolpyruvate--protein phosphotransferase [Paenarthrobacter sp. DKR-5]MBT1003323.1 phosphoenolpyruvate--protein phosphotransferase [Paenarthrobacter sp. DKR-5]